MLAKQSTALTVVVGPILDSTGAEYASAVIGDLSISKNGGTLTAMASAATLTYIANGMYTLVTTTGNMDTLGAVQVTCNKATYQMPKMERNIVPASVYDAIITNATNSTGGLPTADALANYVWDALLASHTTANTFGARIVRAANSNNEVQMTGGGSKHIFAVLHDAEPNSIPEDAFVDGALSARALNADAATEIANAVAAPSAATIADAVWDEILAGHLGSGTTGEALNNSGGSGNPWITDIATGYSGTQAGNVLIQVKAKTDLISASPTINVYPVSASTPERVAGTTITYYRNEIRTVSVVTDFTLTSLTLTFTVEDSEGTDLLTIANASISRSDKTFTVSIGTAVTATVSNYRWALRDITGGSNSVIARGVLTVQEAG